MPDLPVPSLPPCRVDPKVLGLDVLIDHSEPGRGVFKGGPCAWAPPPLKLKKNYEKRKINRKWKERRPSDIVYFK